MLVGLISPKDGELVLLVVVKLRLNSDNDDVVSRLCVLWARDVLYQLLVVFSEQSYYFAMVWKQNEV